MLQILLSLSPIGDTIHLTQDPVRVSICLPRFRSGCSVLAYVQTGRRFGTDQDVSVCAARYCRECTGLACPVQTWARSVLTGAYLVLGVAVCVWRYQTRLRTFDEKVLLGDNRKLRQATGWEPTTVSPASAFSCRAKSNANCDLRRTNRARNAAFGVFLGLQLHLPTESGRHDSALRNENRAAGINANYRTALTDCTEIAVAGAVFRGVGVPRYGRGCTGLLAPRGQGAVSAHLKSVSAPPSKNVRRGGQMSERESYSLVVAAVCGVGVNLRKGGSRVVESEGTKGRPPRVVQFC